MAILETPVVVMVRHIVLLAPLAFGAVGSAQEKPVATDAHAVFAEHCYRCHGDGRVRGGVDLLRWRGTDQKQRVVAGKPDDSRLLQAIMRTGDPAMPPNAERLSDRNIATIRKWIESGAEPPKHRGPLPDAPHKTLQIQPGDRAYWAFRPLKRPPTPRLSGDRWPRTDVDRFILHALRENGLSPNPPASRAVLVRRMCLGVVGLPPTAEQQQTEALDDLATELLASPHYGERWARHWLDLARFAESTGYEGDQDRRYAYQYRDAVIRSLNADLPYERFVRWQIAGDEFDPDNRDAIALTGFLAAGPTITNEGGDRVKYEKLDDIVSTTGSAFLGLTIGCARCHDHKYDPISQRDYYEMVGVFLSCREQDVPLTEAARDKRTALQRDLKQARARFNKWRDDKRQDVIAKRVARLDIPDADKTLLLAKRDRRNKSQKSLLDKFGKTLRVNDREMERNLPEADRTTMKQLRDEQDRINKEFRSTDQDLGRVMMEGSQRTRANYLLGRGDYRNKSEKIGFGFLKTLMPSDDASASWFEKPPKDAKTPWRRRALGRWITDVERGAGALLARVVVNRIWQHHFGQGLVRTAGNFGLTGDHPSHPELLEWLACELVANDWSLKHIHRVILDSAVYRQSCATDPIRGKIDPANRLWWHRRPLRMEAEVWRDSVMAVSGTLNPKMFGPSIKPWMPTEAITTGSRRNWPTNVKDGPVTWRRSIYIYTKRSILMPMLEVLDFPDATLSCSVRNTTTVPPAALLMLNNAFTRDQAGHLARRVTDGRPTNGERIRTLYHLALAREPSAVELAAGESFLQTQARSYAGDTEVSTEHANKALVNYCQVLLSLNEFLYIN